MNLLKQNNIQNNENTYESNRHLFNIKKNILKKNNKNNLDKNK
jgi:hypothetical protein